MSAQPSTTNARPGREGLFTFPNPVNELAARSVAAGVLVSSAGILALSLLAGTGWLWLTVVLAYGFVARVATGPTLSPLGQVATRVVAPRLGAARLVAGPPKRFAQVVGAVVIITTVVLVATGLTVEAQALLAVMIIFAGLESIFAICVGCRIFGALMRGGFIPAETCEACANIELRSVASRPQS